MALVGGPPLERLRCRITKFNTNFRQTTAPGLKLAVTLRYYATGTNYHAMRFPWRVPHNSISIIVKEVSEAIISEFADEVVSTPGTEEGWKDLAEQFGRRWNFHHALGAIDGKHIAIKKPNKSGSLFYN